MATEPITTSNSYSSSDAYTPPVGRLPVLGKARVQIDQLRASIAATLNEMKNRDAAQATNASRVAAEIVAMQAQTVNSTAKTNSEVALMTIQGNNDTTRTNNDTVRADIEVLKISTENAALESRTTAEVALLEQKTATEIANVSDTVPAGVGAFTGTIAGITGSQKTLYAAQAAGFERDAEQKLTKIMADTWSIQKSMSEEMHPDEAGIAEYQIKEVIDKARNGIGLANSVPLTP